jgi:D-sedoheptulose 7-phosphate isomerase
MNSSILNDNIDKLVQLLQVLPKSYSNQIGILGREIAQALKSGATIYWCGNGGSAAESQHMAAELMGRFLINRKPYRSLSLTTDTSAITGIANDFDFSEIFSRQLEGKPRHGDYLVVFSTSGNSENVIMAIRKAKTLGVRTIAFLGENGGNAKGLSDFEFFFDSNETARIQEAHTLVTHTLCQIIEAECEG